MNEWGELQFGGRQLQGLGQHGLGVWQEDVDNAITVHDADMVAINAAIGECAAMAPGDVQAWTAAYEKWQKVKSDWAFDKTGSIAPGPVYGTGILARVQDSTNDATTYWGKLRLACPPLAPPAPNANVSQGSSWVDDLKTAGKVVVGVVVTGVVVYAAYQGVKLVSAAKS